MGKLTNKFNLPAPLFRAIENDPYDAGDCDISTTRLISPPQIVALRKRYDENIEEDASERIWSLIGQATHVILERAGNRQQSERRYFAEIDGWKISGGLDFFDEKTLMDWKVTSVWSIIFDSRRKEWTQQGNVNRWLAEKNGRHIEALENFALLRDWNKKKAKTDSDYPQIQVVSVPLELWPLEKTEQFVRSRIQLHQAAQQMPDDLLPRCTDEEIWKQRTGVRTRCAEYCSVSKFCQQEIAALKGEHHVARRP